MSLFPPVGKCHLTGKIPGPRRHGVALDRYRVVKMHWGPRRCSPGRTSFLGLNDPMAKSSLNERGRWIGGIRPARKGRTAGPIMNFADSIEGGVNVEMSTGPEGAQRKFVAPRWGDSASPGIWPISLITSSISISPADNLKSFSGVCRLERSLSYISRNSGTTGHM